jgi:very-short-patch-repair endonuclease
MSKIHNHKYLEQKRKRLRNNLTPAEAGLWIILKSSALNGIKFRRQHSVGNYILDFYCPQYKLAIELDGEVHNSEVQKLRDEKRTEYLNSVGITVLRFENKEVFEGTDNLLSEILKHCSNRGM